MSTIHKCDKCGKNIESQIGITFVDFERRIFDGKTCNSFDFCIDCARPLAVFIGSFLKNVKH